MLIPFDPIIYKAVADRIGLIPHPQGVVGFYMRMVEIQQAVQVISVEVPGDAPVSAENAETLAGSLIVAGQLARSVISHGPSFGPDASLDEQVSRSRLQTLMQQ